MGETEAIDRQLDERMRKAADDHSQTNEQHVKVPIDNRGNGPASGVLLGLAVTALVLGTLGFALSLVALSNSSTAMLSVATSAESAGRAAAKSETATARANVSEIYAKQVYTELNRLGYPVKTPAEEHAPQPSDNVSKEPGK